MNLPHALTRDVELKGYKLKKGTGIIHQIANVMTDETVSYPEPDFDLKSHLQIFENSYSFNPNRFIDENGKLRKVEELCPFSMGKRQCLGEGLARMEIFLLAANLFNYFEVSLLFLPTDFHVFQFLPSSDGLPSLFKDFSLVSHVIPFKCRVEMRNQNKVIA